jgi:Putative adhesin
MKRVCLCLFVLLAAGPLLGASDEEVFERAFSMDGVTHVSVENVNGRIEAMAWDKPYLRVKAVKSARGGDSAEVLKETEIRVRKVGDRIEIVTISPQRRRLFGFLDWGNRRATVDYELHMPAEAELRIETTNGKVEAAGFGRSLSAEVVNGSIELKEIECPVRATTVNGSVRLAFKGSLKKTHVETVNGSVDVAFDRSSSIRYDLETVNGRIDSDFDLTVEGKFGPKEARGSYNGGGENLHAETVNGSIRLKTQQAVVTSKP